MPEAPPVSSSSTLRPVRAVPLLLVSSPAAVRRASVSLLGSATLFAAMAMLTRLLSARIPGAEIATIRFGGGIVAVVLARAFLHIDLRPRRWGWLLTRGAFGGVAVLAYFTCIERVGVGVATLINYSAPLWSLLFGWALLGERPTRSAILALFVTLLGLVLVIGVRGGMPAAGALIGVLSAITSGVAITAIRAARRDSEGESGESSWTVFAWFTAIGFLTTLPFAVGPLGPWVTPTLREMALLLAVGVTGIGGQLIMTRALQHVTGAAMGIIHELAPILSLIGGIVWFGEILSPAGAIGSALTIAGVVGVLLAGARVTSKTKKI